MFQVSRGCAVLSGSTSAARVFASALPGSRFSKLPNSGMRLGFRTNAVMFQSSLVFGLSAIMSWTLSCIDASMNAGPGDTRVFWEGPVAKQQSSHVRLRANRSLGSPKPLKPKTGPMPQTNTTSTRHSKPQTLNPKSLNPTAPKPKRLRAEAKP